MRFAGRATFLSTALLPLIWLGVAVRAARADGLAEGYIAPLTASFFIVCNENIREDDPSRRYLIRRLGNDSHGHERVVEGVDQIAVSGAFIVGRCMEGYFLLNTQLDSRERPTPEYFKTPDDWRAALKIAGVPLDIQLQNRTR